MNIPSLIISPKVFNTAGGNTFYKGGLYIGNAEDASKIWIVNKDTGELRLKNNTELRNDECILNTIINTAIEIPNYHSNTPEMTYKKYPMSDIPSQNIIQYVDDFYKTVDEAMNKGNSVLVHCYAGRSRSVSMVIIYIMLKEDVPFDFAYALVLSKRNIISPNDGFVAQMRFYDNFDDYS